MPQRSEKRGGHTHKASEWVQKNVIFDHKRTGNVLEVYAATIFPIEDRVVYSLLTHPDGHEIFSGITACVKRKILHNDGRGNMILEVFNKSDWNVLGLVKGHVISKLLVEQNLSEQEMHFGMVPSSSQMLSDLYGFWKVYDLCHSDVQKFIATEESDAPDSFCGTKFRSFHQQSLTTLYQRFEFNDDVIPNVLRGPVSRTALRQIRHVFEDLIKEIWNIKGNRATLAPYMSSIMKEIQTSEEESCDDEKSADSVKSILEKKATSSSVGASQKVSETISSKVKSHLEEYYGQNDLAEINFSAHNEPKSHPLKIRNKVMNSSTSLNSFGSLESLASLTFTSENSSGKEQGFLGKIRKLVDQYFDEDGLEIEQNDEVFEGLSWLVVA